MHNPKATISRWLTVAILAGWLVLLVPMDARAHFGPEGVNGAQLDLGKDGETSPVGATKTVTGRKFVPNDVVRIFQCPYDATDLLLQCEPLGTAQTDAEGGFTATNVPVPSVLTTPSGPVQCQGFMGSTPCAPCGHRPGAASPRGMRSPRRFFRCAVGSYPVERDISPGFPHVHRPIATHPDR